MGLFSLEKEDSGGSYRLVEIVMGGSKDGASLFSVLLSDRTRCNGHKQTDRKPHLSARENIFIVTMVKHRSRLFGRVRKSSSLEILRTQRDMVLNKLL